MKILIYGCMIIGSLSALISAKEINYSILAKQVAGDNSEILEALKSVPAEHKKGLEFLVTYMPEKDLESISANFLLENVALSYKARQTYPWAKQVPEETFFNDVLPYALLNERRDHWRKDFHNRFSKYVKDSTTTKEAVTAINAAIKKEVDVKYSTARKKANQSPYESMEIHKASCTGLSILLVNAFRSVGIASRIAGTPAWTTKRGNHNWVEVWIPEINQWVFTEYDPDSKGLNHGWFLTDAAMANPQSLYHSVYASSWKKTKQYFPLVWDLKNKSVSAVNVSERYIKLGQKRGNKKGVIDTCELRIDYTMDGKRIAIPVVVTQGDVEIKKGQSPMPSHDMNRFFTVTIKRGKLYQIGYLLPNESKWRHKEVKANKEDQFLRIKL